MKLKIVTSLFVLVSSVCCAGTNEVLNEAVEAYAKSTTNPVLITPLAKSEFVKSNQELKWKSVEGFSVGYLEEENIEKIIKNYRHNFKLYKATQPDSLEGEIYTLKIQASSINGLKNVFEQRFRTFFEGNENIEGEIIIYSPSYIPTRVNCEMIIFSFTVNGFNFKKAKRGRTLKVVSKY